MSNWKRSAGEVFAFGGRIDRPELQQVGIVGLGAIGTSIGLSLARVGIRAVGMDVSTANLERALRRGAIGSSVEELTSFASCGLVFVAVPPSDVPSVANALLEVGDATVVDVASVKAEIATAVRSPKFVPSHPLRGTHLTGPDAGRADLFDGGVWVLCGRPWTSAERVEEIEQLIKRMGALPVRLSPAEHDAYLAVTSHLPHLVASSLVQLLGNRDGTARALVGRGFLDTTRVARANPALWADITIENKSELIGALDELFDVLEVVHAALRDGDKKAVAGFFSGAAGLLEGGLYIEPKAAPPLRRRRAKHLWPAALSESSGRHIRQSANAVADGA